MDDVVKKAEAELRRTDSDLKTGMHKKVLAKLPEIDKLVAEVQAKEPNHPRLANLITTLKAQKEKVEAKLGTTLALTTDFNKMPKPPEPEPAPEPARVAASPTPSSSQRPDGRIARTGADEAQARRDAYRAEEERKAREAEEKQKRQEEFWAFYRSVESDINTARVRPGVSDSDIERHFAATEKLSKELSTIRDTLNKYEDQQSLYEYGELQKAVENAPAWRKEAAENLAGTANNMMEFPRKSKGGDVVFGKQIEGVKKFLDAASRYDANNPNVSRLRAEIESLEKGAAAKVAGTKWEGHSSAPANAAQLAAAGMKFFTGPKGWSDKYSILAVAVKGQWTIQKKNILGAPTLYGLPVNVALQTPEDKTLKQARVFNGTLITVEREGVKPEPPFEGFYVGKNWLVAADSVK